MSIAIKLTSVWLRQGWVDFPACIIKPSETENGLCLYTEDLLRYFETILGPNMHQLDLAKYADVPRSARLSMRSPRDQTMSNSNCVR